MNMKSFSIRNTIVFIAFVVFCGQFVMGYGKNISIISPDQGRSYQKGTTTTTNRTNGVIIDEKVETFCLENGSDNCTAGCEIRYYTEGVPGEWEDCDSPPPEQ